MELDLAAPVEPAREQDDVCGAAPTVLIGPNGAGKSTIVEACELLRKAGNERSFIAKLFDDHGGPPALLRRNARRLRLGVELRDRSGIEMAYSVTLRSVQSSLSVERETASLRRSGKPEQLVLERAGDSYVLPHPDAPPERHTVSPDELALVIASFRSNELMAIQGALLSIEVHTAVEVRAPWTLGKGDGGPRDSNIVRPVSRVEIGGRNLPNVYHALRNQSDWPQTMERVRAALGDQIESVITPADPSGGRIGLALHVTGVGQIDAFAMSDGQLAYLALLGVMRLQRGSPALVVFDEPDLHLHPGLTRRLMADLEAFSRSTPVLVTTHSDAMLDALTDPARSSVLCELDEHHATRLERPDRASLERWLEDYRGLGELRAAGYEHVVFPVLESP
ncbi:MAG TPA: ATP-binding protein [Kofleriaceae bacterium]|nr:ATP-binding protein [Kofleriaceae bacterium]